MPKSIKIYNSLKKQKENFSALEKNHVKFYSCGPTTYDFLHVGNGRALVVGDLIHRVFLSLGYKVTFVRNFTDIDDKILDRARELNVDPLEHSERFIQECKTDMSFLGMLPATHTPKVSETMDEIIELIKTLEEKGVAYEVDGEVLFHTPLFEDYGKLSKQNLENLDYGNRVRIEDNKKHPTDFVLWKPSEEGEIFWESPWGKGRPGWHIECSAMSRKFLGNHFDIHHGGVDLVFPHHENEIAQSEVANGCSYCDYWVHNEFLSFNKEKMSKSLGNVVIIRNFCEKFGGKILRQILLSVHYRSRIDWSEEVIRKSVNDLERINNFVQSVENSKLGKKEFEKGYIEKIKEKIYLSLANDFNVPTVMAEFFSLIRNYNRTFSNEFGTEKTIEELKSVIDLVRESTGLAYSDFKSVEEEISKARKELSQIDQRDQQVNEDEILKLLEERKTARDSKDWKRSDEIRDKLKNLKIEVKDNLDGTTSWQYEK